MARVIGRRAFPFVIASVVALAPRPAAAQLGAMVSPGGLAKAHASLEGVANCQMCHEAGKQVTAAKCLSCHKPVADRIRLKKGVHKAVAGDCVTCHVEHAGEDAELRPFDTHTFNHAREAGFALDGRHARVPCASCHKSRSFLAAKPACSTCHADVHKGQLGLDCARCHSVTALFKEARTQFDHSRTSFALTGAHGKIDCAKCHPNGRFKGAAVRVRSGEIAEASRKLAAPNAAAACATCHETPHRAPLGATCTGCHSSESWKTQKIQHARTGFALNGLHGKVECARCHRQPATRVPLKFQKCADCHADPHAGRFKQDCASCHNERGFGGAPFDHAVQTHFALTGAHVKLQCAACHKPAAGTTPRPATTLAMRTTQVTDFSGLKTDCASCHRDVHAGDAGSQCLSCHTDVTFHDVTYVHQGGQEFFGGSHKPLTCAKCHGAPAAKPSPAGTATASDSLPVLTPVGSRGTRRSVESAQSKIARSSAAGPPQADAAASDIATWRFKGMTTACGSCHQDPHLGQVGTACERCHAIGAAQFVVVSFSHQGTVFPLTGRHERLECRQCHKPETAQFPAASGTAVRLTGIGTRCQTCHTDVHLGQVGSTCETCHATTTFRLASYTHQKQNRALADFFVGKHLAAQCQQCHKAMTARFPGGTGHAVQYRIDARCVTCHTDVHRGQLGDRCIDCHRLKADARPSGDRP